jgi:putative ABC transport system permease protein
MTEWLSEVAGALYRASCALRRAPVFSFAVLLTFALGVGLNAAVFSLVSGLLLQPLPYKDPDRLVVLRILGRVIQNNAIEAVPQMSFVVWRDQARSFEAMAAVDDNDFPLVRSEGTTTPDQVQRFQVTRGFLGMLGCAPVLGRDFEALEHQPGHGQVAIITDRLSRRLSHGRAEVVGSRLLVNDRAYTIVGVLPSRFLSPVTERPAGTIPGSDVPDSIFTPMEESSARTTDYEGGPLLRVIARLGPGISADQAQAETNTINARLSVASQPTREVRRVRVETLRTSLVKGARPALVALTAGAALMLLIVLTNISGLVLVRSVSRRNDLLVRRALGAGRWKAARPFFAEGVLLAVGASVVGLALARGTFGLVSLVANPGRQQFAFSLNGYVVAFVLGLSVLLPIGFLLVAVWSVHGPDLATSLKTRSAGLAVSRLQRRFQQALVICQIAVATSLMVGACVMALALWRLSRVDLGFRSDHLLTAFVRLPLSSFPDRADRLAFFERAASRMQAVPGVDSVGMALALPIAWKATVVWGTAIEGGPNLEDVPLAADIVSPGYARAMGIRMSRGRWFTEDDSRVDAPVVVVNEAMARRYWPNGNALEGRVRFRQWRRVVGVVSDVRHAGPEGAEEPRLYLPHATWSDFQRLHFVVRTKGDPAALAAITEREIQSAAPTAYVAPPRTMESLLANVTMTRRLVALLLAGFGLLALALTAVGTAGTLLHFLAQRTTEMGIRLALGASQIDLAREVVKEGLILSGTGMLIGSALAVALRRTLASLLFGAGSGDTVGVGAVLLVIWLVGLGASWVPARRTLRLLPIDALRSDQ